MGKPSRKMIDGKGAKQKSQLQAALQQHSQQLAQLQQLQQLNQQLQQQVQQQRQLKQQNQQTLAALQQNAIANQQQLAALQQNVAQLQQLEQTILAQQTTAHNQQHQQLQQRVQQIVQQKLQLQQQIKQFQQQVEQQLAYTQHAGPVPPPPLPQAPPPGKKAVNGAPASEGSGGGEEEAGASYVELGQGGQEVQTTDLNFLMCGEQLQFDQQGFMAVGPGGVPAGIDPSLLTSAWPAEPGDAPVYQVATTGGQVQLQYASPSSQHSGAGGPITNFGHQLLLPTQFSFGPGTPGLPVLEGSSVAVSGAADPGYGLQLAQDGSNLGLGFQQPPLEQLTDKKKPGKKKVTATPLQQQQAAVQQQQQQQLQQQQQQVQQGGGMLGDGNYAGHYLPSAQYGAAYPPQPAPGVPVVDLDSETDSNHDTALTLACAAGHDKVVEILLNHGADIEAQSERTKDTPLSLACSGGRYEVVEILLSRGANKEHRNVSDYTPLSLAASGGYTNIIKLLLAHGAEINSRTGSKLGISPLMLAAMNGHTAAVKLLLDMGSDINAQIETNRNTALTLACFQGRHEVVSLLLDRKANVEHRAKTG